MKKNVPAWKSFEELIERLQRSFHPDAQITKNDHLPGHDTGRSREIDISIRYKFGTTSLLIIADCKKHNRKIDLPELHAFIGLMTDVKANAGMLICERGFSKSSKRLASKHNIELFTFQDTKKPNWQFRMKVPVCVDQWVLTPQVLNVIYADGRVHPITKLGELELTDVHTGKKTLEGDLAVSLWEEHHDKKDGPVCWSLDVHGEAADSPQKLEIGFNAERQRFTRWATLSLVGLTKASDGLTYTDKFDITTNEEPPSFHTENDTIPPRGEFPIGVVVKTTSLNTAKIDLKKNVLAFSLTGKPAKPISLRLPVLK